MSSTPYVASLRIFEPISAFPAADRLRWESISADIDTREEEQALALRRLVAPESPALRPDGVHILDLDGSRFVSPWSPQRDAGRRSMNLKNHFLQR